MVINLDECRVEPGQILDDGVRQWRPDCKSGQFKIGASNMRGQRLDMEIIAARSHYGSLFGYEPMWWVGLLFVDNDGVLSSILFKTESRDNFLELITTVKVAGKSILGNSVRASMSQRAGKGKDNEGNMIAITYFVVEFEISDKPAKYALAIADLRSTTDCNSLLTFRETAVVESKSQVLAAVRASA